MVNFLSQKKVIMKLFTMKLSTKPYTTRLSTKPYIMRLSTNITKLSMTLFTMKKKVIGRLELFVTTVVQIFLVMHQTILKNISRKVVCLMVTKKFGL